ncbi:hypothetical protein ACFSDD_15345 [Salipiger marinus]|jgi:hypothetical protein|uniref:Lipoprotein n=1 Tax=Salipiger marinus TaxID=555512 RepID=A0A1G8RKT4_9RHOB|nr:MULTISPECIES: hypothetical protein [Salipiger]HBM62056.1 hypothetical protein [Citreicella sp.]MCD1617770.1 hypothetical protein [Salipiger manganoxidans]MEB3418302.1 hypothetical protein [Salipiger manganoxidans]SDJ17608.1 hypothetical protein SAMN04487993_102094 [Salipiger marinus]HBT00868.1 hypothetical protein [Citreicella sp.]
MKSCLFAIVITGAALGLAGCSSVAGTVGTAVAGNAVAGKMSATANRSRFEGQSCEELAREMASARMGYINPLNAPATQAYIREAQQVARAKNCPEPAQ